MTWYELQGVHVVFMLLNVVMWVSLYHAATIDPGFLPRNIPEYDRAIKEVNINTLFDETCVGSIHSFIIPRFAVLLYICTKKLQT